MSEISRPSNETPTNAGQVPVLGPISPLPRRLQDAIDRGYVKPFPVESTGDISSPAAEGMGSDEERHDAYAAIAGALGGLAIPSTAESTGNTPDDLNELGNMKVGDFIRREKSLQANPLGGSTLRHAELGDTTIPVPHVVSTVLGTSHRTGGRTNERGRGSRNRSSFLSKVASGILTNMGIVPEAHSTTVPDRTVERAEVYIQNLQDDPLRKWGGIKPVHYFGENPPSTKPQPRRMSTGEGGNRVIVPTSLSEDVLAKQTGALAHRVLNNKLEISKYTGLYSDVNLMSREAVDIEIASGNYSRAAARRLRKAHELVVRLTKQNTSYTAIIQGRAAGRE